MVKTDADPKASPKNTLYYIYLYVNTHPSPAGRAQDRVSSPAIDRRSANCATQPTTTTSIIMMIICMQLSIIFYSQFIIPMEREITSVRYVETTSLSVISAMRNGQGYGLCRIGVEITAWGFKHNSVKRTVT